MSLRHLTLQVAHAPSHPTLPRREQEPTDPWSVSTPFADPRRESRGGVCSCILGSLVSLMEGCVWSWCVELLSRILWSFPRTFGRSQQHLALPTEASKLYRGRELGDTELQPDQLHAATRGPWTRRKRGWAVDFSNWRRETETSDGEIMSRGSSPVHTAWTRGVCGAATTWLQPLGKGCWMDQSGPIPVSEPSSPQPIAHAAGCNLSTPLHVTSTPIR